MLIELVQWWQVRFGASMISYENTNFQEGMAHSKSATMPLSSQLQTVPRLAQALDLKTWIV